MTEWTLMFPPSCHPLLESSTWVQNEWSGTPKALQPLSKLPLPSSVQGCLIFSGTALKPLLHAPMKISKVGSVTLYRQLLITQYRKRFLWPCKMWLFLSHGVAKYGEGWKPQVLTGREQPVLKKVMLPAALHQWGVTCILISPLCC